MDTTARRFEGKRTIVTAGASGIGRAIVERLLSEGAHVVVGDIAVDEGSVSEQRSDLIMVRADASREDDVASLVNTAVERFGGLDCAFNVAGMGGGGAILDTTATDWDQVLAVTLRSTFLGIKHAAAAMLPDQRGAIVNIASINAIQAAEGAGSYNAAKAGVVNLTMTAALELGPSGIRVNAIGPGLIETPMTETTIFESPATLKAFHEATPLGRHGQPEEIAAAAAFLASDDAGFITGQTLYVDGGQTASGYPKLLSLLFPDWADRASL